MNREQRAVKRSLKLHRAIAKKLQDDPSLWEIPRKNLKRWKKNMGDLPPALKEWEDIFHKYSYKEIYKILNNKGENASRLRSSSPFTGILTEQERMEIILSK